MRIGIRHLLLIPLCATGIFCSSCRTTTVPPDRVSLDDIRAEFGLPRPKRFDGTIAMEHDLGFLSFTNGSRGMLFDDCMIWLNASAKRDGRQWTLSQADRTRVLEPLFQPETVLYRCEAARVVIDPGHGGTDPGAVAITGNVLEKDVVFDISDRVCRKLQLNGVYAKLSRRSDQGLTLAARSARARREAADLFVSIHANAALSAAARGIESFVLPAPGCPSTEGNGEGSRADPGNEFDQASMLLAYHIHRKLIGRIDSPDRGIKRARFVVLRDAPCPAVLVECGFLSNAREARELANPTHRQRLADAIADGILEYRQWTEASHRVMLEALNQSEDIPEAPETDKPLQESRQPQPKATSIVPPEDNLDLP